MANSINEKIWLSSPHMGGAEQGFVKEAFDTNWIAPLGPNVTEFENAIASFVQNDTHAACLSSGTGAIHLALELLDVKHGDEVLCQSFTFSASANPILYLGAKPVFIDSEFATWNMCPDLLEKAIIAGIDKGKKPKAIIAVHLYGMPYNTKRISELSNTYDIPVIEDSAEALGSHVGGIKCGSFGTLGILSFNGNKIITTSGGGALLTKKKELKDKAIFLATQARDDAPHYQHSHVGYNYRMSNVLAGIGRGQMQVLQDRVSARRANFNYYKKHLSLYTELSFLEEVPGSYSNRWLSCILTDSYEMREKIRLTLAEENIESRPLWKPMHLQPIFSKADRFENGVSESLFEKGLCLPSGSNLTEGDLNKVCELIKKALK